MPRPRKYPTELLDRGVRLVFESERPIAQVARDLGVHPEALRKRVRQAEAEAEAGKRSGLLTSQEREEIRELRRENYELRRANEILKSASVFFRQGTRPRSTEVSAFIGERRQDFGVEPICETLGVSASARCQRATSKRSTRATEDELLAEIRKTHKQNYEAYGSGLDPSNVDISGRLIS